MHTLFAILAACIMAVLTSGISTLASTRVAEALLSEKAMTRVVECANFCFAVVGISSISLMLIEVAFRRAITYLQYALVVCALGLFFLLLLALSEMINFMAAYGIVTVMTVALICWFVRELMGSRKATAVCGSLLVVEYGLLLMLVYIGSTALLVGSLTMFALIAVAMYFTLKLKKENDEFVLK